LAKHSRGQGKTCRREGCTEREKKIKKKRRKFKDAFDVIENATDEEFAIVHRRLEQKNLYGAGWLLLKRIEVKGYAPL
jgi:hypothetical protein